MIRNVLARSACLAGFVVLTLTLTGCSSEPEPADTDAEASEAASATAATTATATAGDASEASSASASVASNPGTVKVAEKTDAYEFSFAYPGVATQYPKLETFLKARRKDVRAELVDGATSWQKEAAAEDIPFNPYSHDEEWKVVTETPALLSLSSGFYLYSGGAHGISGSDSIIWDKAHDRLVKPMDFAVSPKTFGDAIRASFCDKLDAEREERRGEPVTRNDGMFSECIDPVEQTVLFGSSNRKAVNRIGILVGPYAAGPYAEGEYEINLPVTQKVLAAIKPEYRDMFAAVK